MNTEPIAYFLTFTVYGTFLQGDARWWYSRRKGVRQPEPRLEQWHRERLKHDVILFDREKRKVVQSEVQRLCQFRKWKLWEVNPRTNHVHVALTALGVHGKTLRDQIKANCTRALRERWPEFKDRPVWSVGGDWQCINTEDDLEQVIAYIRDAQDRKGVEE
jgi:REP element-mobilizing transposase RayT